MSKNVLLGMALTGIFGLNAQIYKDITPACFVQNVDNNCASACADFNGDGKPDILLTGIDKADGKRKTWLYLNDGTGGFTLATNTGIDKGFIHSSISAGDYDGDGDMDFVVQGWCTYNGTNAQLAVVYKNNGTGMFTEAATLDGRSNGIIEFGDYDNDGRLDILQIGWKESAEYKGGKVNVYHNDGNDIFSDINNTTLFPMADGHARFGDYDNDGNLDIVLNGWGKSYIYKGDGKGAFVQQDITLPGYNQAYVYWIDYNQDGFKDILTGGLKDGAFFIHVLQGNGTNTFTEMNFGLAGVQKGPIKTGDCNNDGKTDFFISGWSGAGVFHVFKNDGTDNSFSKVEGVNDVIPGWADGTLEVADFDGDGYDEIFKCGWSQTKLYRNTDRPNPPTGINDVPNTTCSVFVKDGVLNIQLNKESKTSQVKLYDLTGACISQFTFSGEKATFNLPYTLNGHCLISISNEETDYSSIICIR